MRKRRAVLTVRLAFPIYKVSLRGASRRSNPAVSEHRLLRFARNDSLVRSARRSARCHAVVKRRGRTGSRSCTRGCSRLGVERRGSQSGRRCRHILRGGGCRRVRRGCVVRRAVQSVEHSAEHGEDGDSVHRDPATRGITFLKFGIGLQFAVDTRIAQTGIFPNHVFGKRLR